MRVSYVSLACTIFVGAVGNCSQTALAVILAQDNANNAPYADGWDGIGGVVPEKTGMDNGGTGFSLWDFSGTYWEKEVEGTPITPYAQPHLIDTGPTAYNDLGAPAFMLTNANQPYAGYTTTAKRGLAKPLKVGDTFSVDIDNPIMSPQAPLDSIGMIVRLKEFLQRRESGVLCHRRFHG